MIKEVNSGFISSDWVIGPTFFVIVGSISKSDVIRLLIAVLRRNYNVLILRELYLKNEYMVMILTFFF